MLVSTIHLVVCSVCKASARRSQKFDPGAPQGVALCVSGMCEKFILQCPGLLEVV